MDPGQHPGPVFNPAPNSIASIQNPTNAGRFRPDHTLIQLDERVLLQNVLLTCTPTLPRQSQHLVPTMNDNNEMRAPRYALALPEIASNILKSLERVVQ